MSATTPNQAEFCDLPEGAPPLVIECSFHLTNINGIDDEAETFEFSGVLTLVWRDSRQTFDPAVVGVEEKLYHGEFQFNELSPGWYPQVVLSNSSGVPEMQGVLLRVKPDGTSTLVQTVNATARSVLNLRRYPFDQQRLEANFEVFGFGADQVRMKTGGGAVSMDRSRIEVPQWHLIGADGGTRELMAPYVSGEGKASAFVVGVEVKRESFFMVRLVILPLILIVLLSWSVFWMDRSSLGDRMSVSFVGILTAVAYQIMVSDIMPQISYVTLMNAILNFSFLLMCATVLINLIVGALDKRGELKRGEKLDRLCRRIFPLAYIVLLLAAGIVAFVWL